MLPNKAGMTLATSLPSTEQTQVFNADDTFFEYSMAISKGTKMSRGDKKAIMEYLVPIFTIEEQQKIAGILNALDGKIELNNAINNNLSVEWQTELGANWKEVQKTYLHTIGNLTLTAYNSEMSDKPFMSKMNMESGFKQSALRLNFYLMYYNLGGVKGYVDGMIPLLLVAVTMLAVTIGVTVS